MAELARIAQVTEEAAFGEAAEAVLAQLVVEYAQPRFVDATLAQVAVEYALAPPATIIDAQMVVEYIPIVTPTLPPGCPLGPGAAPVQGADGCANTEV